MVLSNVIPPSSTINYQDSRTTIVYMLLSFEMAIFSILHLSAYPWKDYEMEIPCYQGGRLGGRAYLNAMNISDLIRGVGRGFKWLFIGRKRREHDISYMHYRERMSRGPAVDEGITIVESVETRSAETIRLDVSPHLKSNRPWIWGWLRGGAVGSTTIWWREIEIEGWVDATIWFWESCRESILCRFT